MFFNLVFKYSLLWGGIKENGGVGKFKYEIFDIL
jgi:hypothetical protein